MLFAKRDKATLYRTERRMLLAAKLDDCITEKGLTQKNVAELLGKTESEVSEWLSGKRNITIDNISDFERVLNVNLLNIESNQSKIIINKPIEIKVSKARKPIKYDMENNFTSNVFSVEYVMDKINCYA